MTRITVKALALAALLPCAGLNAQSRLTPELMWKLGRVSEPVASPDGKEILYGVTYYDTKENKGNRDLYKVPAAGGNPVQLTSSAKSEQSGQWRPDGRKIGYLSSESGSAQVWEMNPDGSGKVQVTFVEEGVDGFLYAPDMKTLVFTSTVKIDQSVQDKYPELQKTEARIIDDLMYRHWDSWDDFSYSHVFYAPYSDGKLSGSAVDIMKGERFDAPLQPMGGMEQVAVSPDGKTIAYTSKKLNGKAEAISTNSDIYLYYIATSKTVNFTEGMKGYDVEPSFSPDGKKLAWLSMEKEGYEADKNRLFVSDLETGKKEDVTAALDQNAGTLQWSRDSKSIYFISGVKATEQVYNVEISNRKITQLTKGAHDYTSITLAGKSVVGSKMSISSPAELYRVDLVKGAETQLTFTNKPTMDQLKLGKVEERVYTASDGKPLHTWVIYPPDFDPSRKYPALLYCQGGPQSTVSQFFSYRWNFQLMAASGYIVVAPNRRGLPSFGKEWNDAIAGDWGGQAIRDYLTAIDSVSSLPFVNKDRLGAVGASYGGYSVYYLAGVHNKRFKTFISHCGLYNLESWYTTTEEMWFANSDIEGPYWNKPVPKSYTQFSPHKLVDKWDTPILVIHNQRDYRVPIEQGMEAFGAAQMRGIQSRFLYFPDEGHWVNKPQNSLLWNKVFFEWLDKYLKDSKS
jgi:dipeptidyl aminopeptidase/acylaminoacyl peptidase